MADPDAGRRRRRPSPSPSPGIGSPDAIVEREKIRLRIARAVIEARVKARQAAEALERKDAEKQAKLLERIEVESLVRLRARMKREAEQGALDRLKIEEAAIIQGQRLEKRAMAERESLRAQEIKKIEDQKNRVLAFDTVIRGLGGLSDMFSQIGDLIQAQTDTSLDLLEQEKERELQNLGLKRDKEAEAREERRKDAETELSDLEKKIKQETNIEKKNELELAAAEKATELDKLREEESIAAQRAEIERRYERQKLELKYKASISIWEMNLANAITEGAMAVLSGFATKPLVPTGILMGIMAGALSGIQIATVLASKPVKPSFATGAFNVPADMSANIHRGEMILPKSMADRVREETGGSGVSISIYSSAGPVETEEATDEEGRQNISVFIGEEVRQNFQTGAFDGVLADRYGFQRRGKP